MREMNGVQVLPAIVRISAQNSQYPGQDCTFDAGMRKIFCVRIQTGVKLIAAPGSGLDEMPTNTMLPL